jgi:hypothetical protein
MIGGNMRQFFVPESQFKLLQDLPASNKKYGEELAEENKRILAEFNECRLSTDSPTPAKQ